MTISSPPSIVDDECAVAVDGARSRSHHESGREIEIAVVSADFTDGDRRVAVNGRRTPGITGSDDVRIVGIGLIECSRNKVCRRDKKDGALVS